ncbi:MAG: GGDEF domain-containing protein [Proteobacteria bacterium]|nr:GGDEF domain-containing protein [Pseudomonadota bacterium]
MADSPSVSEIHPTTAIDSHGQRRQPDGCKRGEGKPVFPQPRERTPRQISDVASVLGIPAAEMTPRLHEAMTILFNDYDRVRWDLQISEQHAFRLAQEADEHSVLPILNRRAFIREVHRVIDYIRAEERFSCLLYICLSDALDIKGTQGLAAFEEFLKSSWGLIREQLEEIDIIGLIDPADFAILLNMLTREQAAAKGRQIAEALSASAITTTWAVLPVDPKVDAEDLLYAVEGETRRPDSTQ